MFNAVNPATGYRTGTEFHLDWIVDQFLSETFSVGITGYYMKQIGHDSGTVFGPIDVTNFQGEGAGIGPAMLFSIPTSGTPVNVIAKAPFDFDNNGSASTEIFS
jgi:hypothetical protein